MIFFFTEHLFPIIHINLIQHMSFYYNIFIHVNSKCTCFSVSTDIHMEKFPGMCLRKSTVTFTYSPTAV